MVNNNQIVNVIYMNLYSPVRQTRIGHRNFLNSKHTHMTKFILFMLHWILLSNQRELPGKHDLTHALEDVGSFVDC